MPNYGRNLGDLLGRSEPIESRHERILQSGGNRRSIRSSRFHDNLGQLFDEEWDTIGLAKDVFDQCWRQHSGRGDAGD